MVEIWDKGKMTHFYPRKLKLFHGGRGSYRVSKKLKSFMCFDYVTIYHSKIKSNEFNVKNIKNFWIEWRS